MRRHLLVIAVLATSFVLSSGCGGGGGSGGGGATVADLGGTWLGPAGSPTLAGLLDAPAEVAGMTVDGMGNMTGTAGLLAGETGTIALVDEFAQTFKWTGTGGSVGLTATIILSPDLNHMLMMVNAGLLVAFQRGAATLLPPYTDAEFRSSFWTGTAAEFDAGFGPINPEAITVTVDALGNFTSGTSGTGVAPLTVLDAATGEIRGDFLDPGPPVETGNLIVLATPDRQFLAIFSCLTGAKDVFGECDCAGLQRN